MKFLFKVSGTQRCHVITIVGSVKFHVACMWRAAGAGLALLRHITALGSAMELGPLSGRLSALDLSTKWEKSNLPCLLLRDVTKHFLFKAQVF